MAKVIQFPDKMQREFEVENDVSANVMHSMIETMIKLGYMPHEDLILQKDLGLVYHILFAAVCRAHGKHHPFHDTMTEIMDDLTVGEVDPESEM